MDVTQLLITVISVLGIALVGAMAVVPAAMDARAGRDDPRPAAPVPVPGVPRRRPPHGRPARRHPHRPVDLAA